MELKVWCDGIQRIVCGATTSTTCQDVVFALAHATGQTGRFILIEKWKNNERVLSPNDQPIISLTKWGEYANDVIFIMKKSGDVNNSKQNKVQTPKLSKKSDFDLIQKRKKINQENQDQNNLHSKSMPLIYGNPNSQLSHISNNNTMREQQQHYLNNDNCSNSSKILLKKSSSHQQQLFKMEDRNFSSLKSHNNNKNNHNNLTSSFHNSHVMYPEPLYGSLNNRPRQPPPYQEAIAKSSLVNILNNTSNNHNNNSDHNHTTTINIGSSQTQQSNKLLSQNDNMNPNQNQVKSSPMFHSNTNHHQSIQQQSSSSSSTLNDVNSLQQKTISLISIQQKTLKKQGKNMTELENEIDLVQRKLSENEFIVNRYKDEMEFLKQKWIEQEMLIEKLESENLEKELEKLINDGKRYEQDMREIKLKLSNCENEIIKRRDEICILMNKIEDHLQLNLEEFENLNDSALIDRLKVSIQEKNNKIKNQRMDLEVLNDSIDHFDQTIQTKNNIIDKLIYQIKEANVEGLALQSGTSTPSDDKNHYPNINDPLTLKSGINRKIPVSLHELGNTVPTKKNPDGIWV